jgi:hypothetical protein
MAQITYVPRVGGTIHFKCEAPDPFEQEPSYESLFEKQMSQIQNNFSQDFTKSQSKRSWSEKDNFW